jgi:hypothetical protein
MLALSHETIFPKILIASLVRKIPSQAFGAKINLSVFAHIQFDVWIALSVDKVLIHISEKLSRDIRL